MALEWMHLAMAAGGVVVGAISGLVAGVWRVAQIEHEVREDVRNDIAEAVRDMADRIKESADQFDETLKGLRQKINDVELGSLKLFVAKPDFDDFRKEYREDMRDLKQSIGEIKRK